MVCGLGAFLAELSTVPLDTPLFDVKPHLH